VLSHSHGVSLLLVANEQHIAEQKALQEQRMREFQNGPTDIRAGS